MKQYSNKRYFSVRARAVLSLLILLSPNGSWGNISELSFYDEKGNKLTGCGIANAEASQDTIDLAYDGNLLSNFDINQADGGWVGIDTGKPTKVQSFSVSPCCGDNYICPDNEYELFCLDGRGWHSLDHIVAETKSLHYDDIPLHALLLLRNYTRGYNERPFIINETGEIEWC